MAQKIKKILSLFDWDSSPLIPAIAQEADTKEILMLAFVNKEALKRTLQSGQMHYFSRSKNRLWHKGEQSGHIQIVQKILVDCDNDALVFLIKQKGVACHTGQKSCFFRELDSLSDSKMHNIKAKPINYGVIDELYHTLLERKNANPSTSYTALLYAKGIDTIAKKIIEEASEVALALKDCQANNAFSSKIQSQHTKDSTKRHTKDYPKQNLQSPQAQNPHTHLVYECADLLYHSLVALAKYNIHPDQVKSELARRFGLSGLAEKASRKSSTKKTNLNKSSKNHSATPRNKPSIKAKSSTNPPKDSKSKSTPKKGKS